MTPTISRLSTLTVIRVITLSITLDGLERYDAKVSRTVLRGEGRREPPDLPDTELIFAVFDLLGLKFTPRIRDLKEQTLYRIRTLDLSPYPTLAPCLTGIVQDEIVHQSWDEMLRFVGSLKLGWVTASLVIQKLQAYPRKSQLTRALQAYGRLPKTIHILGWYSKKRQGSGPRGNSTKENPFTICGLTLPLPTKENWNQDG